MIDLLPQTPQQRLIEFALRHWAVIALAATLTWSAVHEWMLRTDIATAEAKAAKATAERDAANKRASDFEASYLSIASAAREQSVQIVKLKQDQDEARAEGEKKAALARADAAKYRAAADALRKRQYTPGRDPVEEVSAWVDELLQAERQ